jgi:CubicO group peptidase (beta-lactamase class C family)
MLLALILQNATGQAISDYASEKLWKPLGAKHSALWSLDKYNGDELAWCCFYATARDFARFGQLYLNEGQWGNRQLVSQKYVKESVSPALLFGGSKSRIWVPMVVNKTSRFECFFCLGDERSIYCSYSREANCTCQISRQCQDTESS